MRRTLALGDVRNARLPKDITILPATLGEWVIPRGASLEGRAILYMHGGAMVFTVDYRRAPEYRSPAALEDCIAAYRFVRERIPEEGLIFAGGSAGGNLALATLLALRERDGNPKPCAGVIAMSRWTDLAATGPSGVENADSDDVLAPPTKDVNIALAYADEAAFTNPLVSPLYGEYAGAPPILLFASTIEMLRDDSTRLAEKLRGTGVDVRLNLVADMPHCWPIFPSLPEAAAAQREMSHFAQHVWLEPDRPLPDAVGI